jgi:hypothetical protein
MSGWKVSRKCNGPSNLSKRCSKDRASTALHLSVVRRGNPCLLTDKLQSERYRQASEAHLGALP